MLGALVKVEKFTFKKLLGVLASILGVLCISSVDILGDNNNDQDRGSFPYKSKKEIAIGDALALASAIMYGVYTTLMTKRVRNESRVNMPLFFGFVGLFTLLTLSPGLLILHFTGVEQFSLPPTSRVWIIVLVSNPSPHPSSHPNSPPFPQLPPPPFPPKKTPPNNPSPPSKTNATISILSDFTWAYAILLTSPLVVTVGLSLSIPFSLIGQTIINHQSSSVMYWVGAGIVFLSFALVNCEGAREEGRSGLGGG